MVAFESENLNLPEISGPSTFEKKMSVFEKFNRTKENNFFLRDSQREIFFTLKQIPEKNFPLKK